MEHQAALEARRAIQQGAAAAGALFTPPCNTSGVVGQKGAVVPGLMEGGGNVTAGMKGDTAGEGGGVDNDLVLSGTLLLIVCIEACICAMCEVFESPAERSAAEGVTLPVQGRRYLLAVFLFYISDSNMVHMLNRLVDYGR